MARAALAVVALVPFGCGGNDGDVLFADDFGAGFPAQHWAGDGALDATTGTPAPSLHLAPTAPLAMATVQTSNPVQVGDGLIFRVAVAVPAGSAGRVFLNDAQVSGDPLGYVNFRIGGDIDYQIHGIAGAVQPLGGHDGAFHELELRYVKNGVSSWSRDGAVQLQGTAANDAMLARIVIDTTASTGLNVDSVEVRAN